MATIVTRSEKQVGRLLQVEYCSCVHGRSILNKVAVFFLFFVPPTWVTKLVMLDAAAANLSKIYQVC